MKINFSYRKNKLPVLAICFLLFTIRGFCQTGIMVTYYNGTEQGYSIATTGKLYFNNDNLMVAIDDAASPTSIPLSIIRKITFSSSALPLKLVEFTLSNKKAQVALLWQTANEVNTSHFIIERSADGTTYESIGQVAALNRNTSSSYSFTDQLPKTGISYYRLKQLDADGKYVFSKTLTITRTVSAGISLVPNPATNYFTITSTTPEKVSVKIFSATGQLMVSGNYAPSEQIGVSKLTPGMYVAIVDNKPYKLIKASTP